MKKYNLSLLFAVATLMLGACQSPIKVDEIVNDVIEQDLSPVEVETSTSRLVKTTYYDKSLFKLPLDHPYWSTTVLSSDTIEKLKEHYGFTDEEMVADHEVMTEEDSKDVSSEKVSGNLSSEAVLTNGTTSSNTNNNVSTSTKPNTNTSNSVINNSNSVTKPNNNQSSSNSSTNTQSTPPVVEEPSEPAPQPTPPAVEETKKPVDLLDWNYIKSTLIAKGESLGMIHETSMNRELDGWESPWQSSYMTVTNEDVIGYISTQMTRISNAGYIYYNLDMVVQSDGNVLIYLIR